MIGMLAGLVVVSVLTAAAVFGLGWQACRVWSARVDRLADPAPMPGEFRGAADPQFELPRYGRFPVDTGPLLIWSEKTAANDELGRHVRWLMAEADRRIGPVE